jgi:hypothetical protein
MGTARLRDWPTRQLPGGANLKHHWNVQVHGTSKLRFRHAKKISPKIILNLGMRPQKYPAEKV